jgi:CO/xanthine dehydrogenase FAD-binding subunit
MRPLTFVQPQSLADALAVLAQPAGELEDTRCIAGGTNLIDLMKPT